MLTEEVKGARLRRMKRTATACLVAAAGLYLLGLQLDGTAAGYLTAGAEAAMVGGLADWFAVTALFRRPLGLPLPHTALVPRQKDELALRLGEYVTSEFLTPDAVRAQLARTDVVERLAAYLAVEENALRLARVAAENLEVVLAHIPDEDVAATVENLLRQDLEHRVYAPVLGRLMARAVAGEVQRPLVDLVTGQAHRHLRRHRESLLPAFRDYLDRHHPVLDFLVTDRRLRRLLDSVASTLEQVERDRQHPLRSWLDGLLRTVAGDLQHDERTGVELQRALQELLDDPQALAALHDLVADLLASLRASLREADDELLAKVAGSIARLGRRLLTEEDLRDRVRRTVADVASDLVQRYGDTLTELIHTQVVERDATAMSRRIELEVGRDLQYIRLNGTAVGALAGLAIHAVTLAVT
jgi:uncharacterized membrane-anchored protein YjiN (DUF445 family)